MKSLNEQIIEFAKKWLKENYSYAYNTENDCYEFSVYLDYQDNHMSEDTVKRIMRNVKTMTKDNVSDAIYEYLDEMFLGATDYDENYLFELLYDEMKEVEEFKDVDIEIYELKELLIFEEGLIFVYVDFNEIINNTEINVDIVLETEESFNNEHAHNCFYEGLETWNENIQEMIEYGELEEKDVSIYRLLESQGYTIEQLLDANENETNSKFLNSLVNEIANTTSMCNSLVVARKMSLNEFLDTLDKDSITITTKDKIGLVDFVYGGGSIIEINLERDFEVKKGEFELIVDGNYGYGIEEIYGDIF